MLPGKPAGSIIKAEGRAGGDLHFSSGFTPAV